MVLLTSSCQIVKNRSEANWIIKVEDQAGNPIEGAIIHVRNSQFFSNQEGLVKTNEHGEVSKGVFRLSMYNVYSKEFAIVIGGFEFDSKQNVCKVVLPRVGSYEVPDDVYYRVVHPSSIPDKLDLLEDSSREDESYLGGQIRKSPLFDELKEIVLWHASWAEKSAKNDASNSE